MEKENMMIYKKKILLLVVIFKLNYDGMKETISGLIIDKV